MRRFCFFDKIDSMDSDNFAARIEAHTHYIAAFLGGFLGIFPIVNAVHFLGSAQTSNLIDIVLGAFRGDWKGVALHALGAVLYCFAIFLVTFLSKHIKFNIKIIAVLVDSTCAFVMWRFPINKNFPLTVYLYPTFFTMAFQWCAFKGAYGFTSSTIFSSNNLRQFIASLTEIFCNGDRTFVLKAKFFGMTLLAFHLGVLTSVILWKHFANAGFLFALLPCGIVVIMESKNFCRFRPLL